MRCTATLTKNKSFTVSWNKKEPNTFLTELWTDYLIGIIYNYGYTYIYFMLMQRLFME